MCGRHPRRFVTLERSGTYRWGAGEGARPTCSRPSDNPLKKDPAEDSPILYAEGVAINSAFGARQVLRRGTAPLRPPGNQVSAPSRRTIPESCDGAAADGLSI